MQRSLSECRGVVVLLLLGMAVSARAEEPPAPNAQTSAPQASAAPQSAEREAAALVRRALQAEAAGDPSGRAALLGQALEVAPDYGPAHWQSGELRLDDRWLTVRELCQERTTAGTVAEYRRRRDLVRKTPADHLRLADWCASVGLADQERVHVLCAYYLHPTLPGLLKRLGLAHYGGRIMSREQIAALKKEAHRADTQLKKWKAELARLRTAIDGDNLDHRVAALGRLRAIRDPAAIPALEQVFGDALSTGGAQAVVAALAAMPEQAATDSLVRHALFSPDEMVRRQAAESLRPRSLFSYVPTMISALQSPIQVSYESVPYPSGAGHRLTLYQVGPLRDYSFVSGSAPTRRIDVTVARRSGHVTVQGQADPDTTLQDQALAAQATEHNTLAQRLNERTGTALGIATENNLGTDPKDWWNWWLDYNEIYRPPYNRVYQRTRFANTAGPTFYRYTSCFVAGTPVWTLTGPMPIEKIRVGESVLAQEPETGELGYRPVIATTVRPTSPLIEIRVGEDVIRATRGHPFWVSGLGWQMAKELKAGQWLHTARGPRRIERVEQRGEAVCYNMVVADYDTYFVGNEQVLVHDNNLRSVTTAIVPGLTAEGETAAYGNGDRSQDE